MSGKNLNRRQFLLVSGAGAITTSCSTLGGGNRPPGPLPTGKWALICDPINLPPGVGYQYVKRNWARRVNPPADRRSFPQPSLEVFRATDQLHVSIEVDGLQRVWRPSRRGESGYEWSAMARKPFRLVVRFGPQHIAEEVFEQHEKIELPARAVASWGSQLAFRASDEFLLPDRDVGLRAVFLDWSQLIELLPDWKGKKHGLQARPDDWQSVIELPYRMMLAQSTSSQVWRNTSMLHAPATDAVELWNAWLEPGLKSPNDHRKVHAIWTPDSPKAPGTRDSAEGTLLASNGDLLSDEKLTLLSGTRHQIVQLSSHRLTSRVTEKEVEPQPIQAQQLRLASPGGYARLSGGFDPDVVEQGVKVDRWRQDTSWGRDSVVHVSDQGFVLPFGHKVSIVQFVPRQFELVDHGTTPIAPQRRYYYADRQQEFVDYPEADYRKGLARGMPFRRVRLLTDRSPFLRKPEDLVAQHKAVDGPLSTWALLDADEPYLFEFEAWDWEGRRCHFRMPLVWVRRTVCLTGTEIDPAKYANFKLVLQAYGDGYAAWRTTHLQDQKIGFVPQHDGADTSAKRDSSLATHSVRFEMDPARARTLAADTTWRLLTFPKMQQALVRLDGVSEFAPASLQTGSKVQYAPSYLDNGFDGDENRGEVFIDVLDAPRLNFGGDRSGGLATPSAEIIALSRSHGPVGGDGTVQKARIAAGTSASVEFATGKFDPLSFFRGVADAAKLLGGIDLTEVVVAVDDVAKDLGRVPQLIREQAEDFEQLAGFARDAKVMVERVEAAKQAFETLRERGLDSALNELQDRFTAVLHGYEDRVREMADVSRERFERYLLERLLNLYDKVAEELLDAIDRELGPVVLHANHRKRIVAELTSLAKELPQEVTLAQLKSAAADLLARELRNAGLPNSVDPRALARDAITDLDRFTSVSRQIAEQVASQLPQRIVTRLVQQGINLTQPQKEALKATLNQVARRGERMLVELRGQLAEAIAKLAAMWPNIEQSVLEATEEALDLLDEAHGFKTAIGDRIAALVVEQAEQHGIELVHLQPELAVLVTEFFEPKTSADAKDRAFGSLKRKLLTKLEQEAKEQLRPRFAEEHMAVKAAQRRVQEMVNRALDLYIMGEWAARTVRKQVKTLNLELERYVAETRDEFEHWKNGPRALRDTVTTALRSCKDLAPAEIARWHDRFNAASDRLVADLEGMKAGIAEPLRGLGDPLRTEKALIAEVVAEIQKPFPSLGLETIRKLWERFRRIGDLVDRLLDGIAELPDRIRKDISNALQTVKQRIARLSEHLQPTATGTGIPAFKKELVAVLEAACKTLGPGPQRDIVQQQIAELETRLSNGLDASQDAMVTVLQQSAKAIEGSAIGLGDLQRIVDEFFDNATLLQNWTNAIDALADPIRQVLVKVTEFVDELAKLQDELLAKIPKELNLRYEWNPRLKSASAFRAELDGKPSTLQIRTHIRKRFGLTQEANASPPSVHVEGELANFQLELIPQYKFVTIGFERVRFVSKNLGKPDVQVKIADVEFSDSLSYLAELAKTLSPGNGFFLEVRPPGIVAGYRLSVPNITTGGFNLLQLSIDLGLVLPFDGGPLRLRAAISQRNRPFLISYGIFGGGGFFGVELSSKRIELVEGALEFGGVAAINIWAASGTAYVTGGIYFQMSADKVIFTGYFRAGGSLTVLSMVTVSACFYMGLSYERVGNQTYARGVASYRVEISIGFFEISVELRIEKRIKGGSSSQRALFNGTEARERYTHFSPDEWRKHRDRFAVKDLGWEWSHA